jgi:endonuclease/exonuclease/phosphatase (EEP) superfamily protein YafD
VALDSISTLMNGTAIGVTVATPRGPLRVLVVDGVSDATIPRTPMLRAVMQTCREAQRAGQPFDVVAGDFNSLARSIGFDALRDAGFVLASWRASGWRGTYPAALPLYDIDHVWVAPGGLLAPATCHMLSSPSTNHRGQLVTLTRLGN